MTDERLVAGVAWAALIGAGVRAVIVGLAARTGNAHPPGRAKVVATVFALVALAGAATLVALYAR